MSKVPYYDSDRRLLCFLSPVKCEGYLLNGIAYAVRAKNGQIVRLYRKAVGRAYGSAAASTAAMHAAASETTQRLRDS